MTSIETTVDYILTYNDPDRPVEGAVKTRYFLSEEDARYFIERLPNIAPRAHGIKLERWTRTVKKETLSA